MKKTFLRRSWNRYSKLGKKRKNKLRWKKPTGRHNKLRDKKRGYGKLVSIGYQSNSEERGRIKDLIPIRVENFADLEKATNENIIILGRIGKKNKIKIIEKAKEKGIHIQVVNIKKFLKKNLIKGVDKIK